VGSVEGGFQIAKALKADADTVHIALYGNKYSQPPTEIDPSILHIGTIHDSGGFGIGRLPLSRGTFASRLPVRIQRWSVTDEELEGYRIREESKGGTWG
jgi:hypothetical protein